MELDVTVQDVKCSGDSSGSILINNIVFESGIETETFGYEYMILWDSGIDPEKISEDNLFAENLEAGIYEIKISGTGGSISDPLLVEIYQLFGVEINNITINSSCFGPASIDVDYSGGLSPYLISYGLNYSVVESGNVASITGIYIDSSYNLIIIDSNGCSVSSTGLIDISFSSMLVEFLSQSPPLVYDDHPEDFSFRIIGKNRPFEIAIWQADSLGNKESIIAVVPSVGAEEYIVSETEDYITYNIAPLIYPGYLILEITDDNSCSYDSQLLVCDNYAILELDIVVQNIKCSGDSSGYILINNIIAASGIETEIFSNGYSVVWVTGEVLVSSTGLFPSPILIQGVDPEKISENSIFAGGLEAGTYGARIITSGIVSSTGLANAFNRSLDSIFYYSSSVVPIEVAGNSTLEINDIIINNPCSAPASIDVDYSGGLSPYSISYGLNFSTETGNLASITGIYRDSSYNLIITDANGCSISSTGLIDISFSSMFVEFLSQSPPLIYDDHPEDFSFRIIGNNRPLEIAIWQADSLGNKESIIAVVPSVGAEEYIVSETGSYITYNIAPLIYPGYLILEVIDSNSCSYDSQLVICNNSNPLSVRVSALKNMRIDNSIQVELEPILETILIPYNLIITNPDILAFIKDLNLYDSITTTLDSIQYTHTVCRYLKDRSGYEEGLIDLLLLGETSDDWYFTISINKGFSVSETPTILTENLYITIGGNDYLVVVGIDDDNTTIKIIRGVLLVSDYATGQFKTGKNIGLSTFDSGSYTLNETVICSYLYSLSNVYIAGRTFGLDFLNSSSINRIIDIYNPEAPLVVPVSSPYISKVNNFLTILNNFDILDNLFIRATDNFTNTGKIATGVYGGYATQEGSYNISYKRWDSSTLELKDIYNNNNIVTGNILNGISDDIYTIKISDTENNIIQIVNDVDYSNHYIAATGYIVDSMVLTTGDLDYKYGDLLIPLSLFVYQSGDSQAGISSTGLFNSILGIDTELVFTTGAETAQISDDLTIAVSELTSYDNSIRIQPIPNNTTCIISGPDDYNYSFSEPTIFINIPDGVYNVSGEIIELTSKYLSQNNYQFFAVSGLEESISLVFDSYANTFI